MGWKIVLKQKTFRVLLFFFNCKYPGVSGIKISLQFHLWKKIISWLSSCQNILLNARRIHFQREIAIEVCILLLPLVSRDWVVLNVCWPVVWISPPRFPASSFFLSLSCCHYCLCALWRLCIFLRSCRGIHIQAWMPIRCGSEQHVRHLPLSTLCVLMIVVTALSATSTAKSQTCLAFCSSGSCSPLATLMNRLDISHCIRRVLMIANVHEFAPTSSWIVTSSEQLVWKLGFSAVAFLASSAQDLINLLLLQRIL